MRQIVPIHFLLKRRKKEEEEDEEDKEEEEKKEKAAGDLEEQRGEFYQVKKQVMWSIPGLSPQA